MPAVFAVKKAGRGRAHAALPGRGHHPVGDDHEAAPRDVIIPRTEVDLSFALPGSQEEILARGVVVNDVVVGSFRRTGVRFIAVQPEHAQLIAGYCRRRR